MLVAKNNRLSAFQATTLLFISRNKTVCLKKNCGDGNLIYLLYEMSLKSMVIVQARFTVRCNCLNELCPAIFGLL